MRKSPGSSDKTVDRALFPSTLGFRFDGGKGLVDIPSAYLLNLAGLTLWVVRQSTVERGGIQIVAGCWVREIMLRRQRMPFFSALWRWVACGER